MEYFLLNQFERSWGGFFFWLFISLVVFLVFREVVCRYWKMNRVVSLLEQIAGDMRRIADATAIADTDGQSEQLTPPSVS